MQRDTHRGLVCQEPLKTKLPSLTPRGGGEITPGGGKENLSYRTPGVGWWAQGVPPPGVEKPADCKRAEQASGSAEPPPSRGWGAYEKVGRPNPLSKATPTLIPGAAWRRAVQGTRRWGSDGAGKPGPSLPTLPRGIQTPALKRLRIELVWVG